MILPGGQELSQDIWGCLELGCNVDICIIYIYIYIHTYVCVCVYVCVGCIWALRNRGHDDQPWDFRLSPLWWIIWPTCAGSAAWIC